MNKLLIASFIVAAVLLPPIPMGGFLPILRPEMIVVGLAIVFGSGDSRVDLSRGDPVWTTLLALIPVAVIAIASSIIVLRTPYTYRDFMVLPMLLQYWLAFCFTRAIRNPESRMFAVKTLMLCCGLSAVVGIAQKFNLLAVNDWLTPLFKTLQLEALQEGAFYGRSVGTVGDPRHYAFFLVLGIGAALVLLVLRRQAVRERLVTFSVLGVCILALFLTASRTAGVTLIVVLVATAYFSQKKTRQSGRVVGAGIVVGVLTVALWSFVAPEPVKERLMMTEGGSLQHSVRARQRDALEPFRKGFKNPIIFITGRGPSKAVLPGSEHSDMGWFLLRYGLVGIGCYLFILLGGLRAGLRRWRSAREPTEAVVALFCTVAMIAWILYAQAESFFKLPQIMSINILVLGLLYAPTRGGTQRMPARQRHPAPYRRPPPVHRPQGAPVERPAYAHPHSAGE